MKIFEGAWEIYRKTPKGRYILRNVYNDNKLHISENVLKLLEEGKTTVSKIITRRIRRKGGDSRKWITW